MWACGTYYVDVAPTIDKQQTNKLTRNKRWQPGKHGSRHGRLVRNDDGRGENGWDWISSEQTRESCLIRP